MRTRGLALGVALVVCLFSAVAATAQQKVDRPFKMTGHSEVVIRFTEQCYPGTQFFPMGCPYEGHGEGVASHLGRIITTDIGIFPIGAAVTIAANGDQLLFSVNNATGLMTVTGGTGRFEGATGVAIGTLTPDGDPIVDPVEGTLTREFSWTAEGRIKVLTRGMPASGRSPFDPASYSTAPMRCARAANRGSERRGSRPGNFVRNQGRSTRSRNAVSIHLKAASASPRPACSTTWASGGALPWEERHLLRGRMHLAGGGMPPPAQ